MQVSEKIIICGWRHMENPDRVRDVITILPEGSTVITGEQSGADAFARHWALRQELRLIVYPAQWTKFGTSAGPKRNQTMLDEQPDRVIAFPGPNSKGTWDMVRRAKRSGIKVEVHEVAQNG